MPRLLLILSAILLLTTSARADRSAVEAAMRSMERAVLAADPAAYLLHVSQSDPIFRREQEHWAADLLLHKPLSFALTIVQPATTPEAPANVTAAPPSPPNSAPAATPARPASFARAEKAAPAPRFDPDRAEFTLAMDWTMADVAGAALKPRSVSFPVIFIREGDAWRFLGELWETVTAPADPATGFHGTSISFDPGLRETAEGLAALMPAIRKSVDQSFGLNIARNQTVKLYTTTNHLLASIYLSYADPIGGWNEPGEAIKLLIRTGRTPERFQSTLAHEYGHVATFELGPKATNMPWWALEGVAEYVARPFRHDGALRTDRRVRQWHKEGRLADWPAMADFRNTADNLTGQVYTQSEHFIAFLTDRFGDAARNRWLTIMAQGRGVDEATREVTKLTFEELDAQWRGTLELLPAESP